MNEKICPQCGSKMVWQRRTIQYERAGIPIILKNVWLYACTECGHELVPGPMALPLLNFADQLFRSAQQLQKITHLPAPHIQFSFPETEKAPEVLLTPI